jgi:hypothetical protein
MVRQVAPKNINLTVAGYYPASVHTTQEVTALSGDLPVGGVSGEQIRTLARIVVPVDPGDALACEGRQRVTNDIGPIRYVVGVGCWWDAYDADDGLATSDPAKVWTRISSLDGQNVDRSVVHHLPLTLTGDVYKVPADWPTGHRIVVCFRADAHSTAWASNGGGDKVTVDDYGVLTVTRWRPIQPDPAAADLQAQVVDLRDELAGLKERVATLEDPGTPPPPEVL